MSESVAPIEEQQIAAEEEPQDEEQVEAEEEQADVSHLGWAVRADHKFPRAGKPLFIPRFKQILPLLGQIPKFAKFYIEKKRQGQRVPMDHANLVGYNPIYGAPIGGIGSGTIGRAFGGAFCRFQMIPGHYSYKPVEADQFILRVAKSSQAASQDQHAWQQGLCIAGAEQKKKQQSLPTWQMLHDRKKIHYRAIYPRSWTTYDLKDDCGVEAVCRQISPVIPHDYQESCLPCSVFVWDLKNTSNEDRDISLAFSFKNGVGEHKFDRVGGAYSDSTQVKTEDGCGTIRATRIHHKLKEMNTTYGLGVLDGANVVTSHKTAFDPLGSGADLWNEFRHRGVFTSNLNDKSKTVTSKGEEIGSAVAGTCWRVPAGQTRQIVFALVWHQPEIGFNSSSHVHKRRYTRYYQDVTGLVQHALSHYKQWEQAIDQWQMPILTDERLPDWFKAAIFNELYFISDGGTVWVDMDAKDIEAEGISEQHRKVMADVGRFAYLEGHEYRMYTTYDVHFNASFALVQLWPQIELAIQYDFARCVPQADPRPSIFLMGETGVIKVAGCVPHDVGDPDSDPWLNINAYFVHPTDQWKDLNLKFILQTWRDYVYTKNRDVVIDIYPTCAALVKRCLHLWDKDNDCLIENAGAADQTYDNWVMTGPSAYCGLLWIGALRSVELMAKELNLSADVKRYQELRRKATESYEKRLWNGEYYNFDCHKSESIRSTVMADQLSGYWFLRMCDLVHDYDSSQALKEGEQASEMLPPEHVASALNSVFENNFKAISGGEWGVVNGAKPGGKGVDKFSIQSEEIWTGINYCLASLMIADGRLQDGLQVAHSMYRSIYESMGIGFQTPEAINLQSKYRSLGYMRPLAIWAMVPALRKSLNSSKW